jgi:hypothetical protein
MDQTLQFNKQPARDRNDLVNTPYWLYVQTLALWVGVTSSATQLASLWPPALFVFLANTERPTNIKQDDIWSQLCV